MPFVQRTTLLMCLLPLACSGRVFSEEVAESVTPADAAAPVTTTTTGSGDAGAAPARCTPGARSCEDRTPLRCTSDERWINDAAPCAIACVDGECTRCEDEALRCNDGAVEECADGAWATLQVCDVTCEAGECVDACTEDAVQCDGDRQVQRCEGTQYVDEEECAALCRDGACVGECEPDSRRCDPDEDNAAQTCDADGQWGDSVACADDTFCVGGSCRPCQPDSKRCSDEWRQRCDDNGEWVTQGGCDADMPACVDGDCALCTPGDRRCTDDTVERCNADGDGYDVVDVCDGDSPTCLDSTKMCGSCTRGDTQCNDDIVQTCTEEGIWDNLTACSGDTPQCVGGACRECDPAANQRRCPDDSSTQACDGDGTWEDATDCTGDTPRCRADLDSDCGCTEGDRRCSGDTPERCEGGAWVTESACEDPQGYCLPATGRCVECEPNDEDCQAGVARECSDSGSWSSLNSCAGETVNCGGCDLGDSCTEDGDCVSANCVDGTCQPPEDCGNGEDDDDDGDVDCADSECSGHTCLPEVPAGWSGPAALWEGSGDAPDCGGNYDSQVFEGKAGLSFNAATCSPCQCSGPPTRCRIDGGWGTSTNGSCTGTFYVLVTLTESGECHSPTFSPNEYSARRDSGAVSFDNCGSATGGTPTRPTPSFSLNSRLCTSSASVGECSSGSCVPEANDEIGEALCVYRAGNQSCPADFPTKHLYHDGINDTRGCTSCSCDGNCGPITYRYYSGINCNSLTSTGSVRTSGGNICTDVGMPRSARFYWDNPTCSAAGGSPVGTVTETNPTTVCCL